LSNKSINIFDQIKLSEPEHSKILSNLLNPLGTHGYKNIFLKLFLEVFCPDLDFDEKEHWIVTAEKERYDIRIKNDDNSKIIIVENKSNNAKDRPNQLYRYWFNGIFLAQYNRKLFGLNCFSKIIYLSPSDYKQPEEQSKTRPEDWDINFDERIPCELLDIKFFNTHIIDWLNKCLLDIDKNSNLYYYITQYRDYWR
jgi:hypothetical protein